MRNNRNSKKENKINESYIDNSNEIEEQQYEEENESLFSKLINPEKPELTPEEEILNYQEEDTLKKRKKIQLQNSGRYKEGAKISPAATTACT